MMDSLHYLLVGCVRAKPMLSKAIFRISVLSWGRPMGYTWGNGITQVYDIIDL
jgi:hypothetical protein